jgi:hypothetical protein
MSAVICAIAKKEELYIHEWIRYHLKLGFDHIYIYDNNDPDYEPSLSCILSQHYPGKVTLYPCPGNVMQLRAYNHFIQNHRQLHTWCAFIDVDEFINIRSITTHHQPQPQHELHRFLERHCPHGSLALNWVLFGSNKNETYEPKPVLQRFTMRQKGVNEHTKNIVRFSDIVYMRDPHTPELFFGDIRDPEGHVIDGPYNPPPTGSDEIACIHHYFTKSVEEFQRKIARGRADLLELRTFEGDFARHDLNDVEDRSALEFFTTYASASCNLLKM